MSNNASNPINTVSQQVKFTSIKSAPIIVSNENITRKSKNKYIIDLSNDYKSDKKFTSKKFCNKKRLIILIVSISLLLLAIITAVLTTTLVLLLPKQQNNKSANFQANNNVTNISKNRSININYLVNLTGL